MGGAIQALWCLISHGPKIEAADGGPGAQAPKPNIKDLADAHVALEGGVTIEPEKNSVDAYNKAYANYSRYLGALSPLYK
jgi:hypothetical protein